MVFFVEFGAYDGVSGSNTYVLEKLGWRGILAEPSKTYKKAAKARRSQCYNLAVYSESDIHLEFLDEGQLSTIKSFRKSDNFVRKGLSYKVNTITLEDLLSQSKAPSYIDYLSVDTEGSEYEILKCFNFNRFSFGIITIEHNFVDDKRNNIYRLLIKNGYVRVLEGSTKNEDWYVNSTLYGLKKEKLFYSET